MDVNELAKALFGKDAKSNLLNSSPGTTTTVYGTAMSDSENGEVQVFISDDAVGSDFGAEPDATIVTLPTSPAVKMGDTVAVTLLGGNTVKHPYVSAVIGSGDETRSMAETASVLSDEAITIAEHIANLTGQYFWYDDDGAHITEIPESEWTDETSPNYHAGHNVLITSEGQLFRIATSVMLGIYESGVDIYDGEGTTEFNSLTSIKPANVRVGPQISNNFNANETEVSLHAGYNDIFSVQYSTGSRDRTVVTFSEPGGYYYDDLVVTWNQEANYRGWHPASTTVGDTNVDILDADGIPTGNTIGKIEASGSSSVLGWPIYNKYGKMVSSPNLMAEYDVTNSTFVEETIFDQTNPHEVWLNLSTGDKMIASNGSLYIEAPDVSDNHDSTPAPGFAIGAHDILLGGPLIGQGTPTPDADSITLRGKAYSVAAPANFRSAIGLGTDIPWTHLAGPAESSLPSGTSDRNGVWYRRKHNMVEVQLVTGGTWSNGKTWNTSAQTIATLPSGCRPGIPIHDTGNVPGANTVGQVIVSTDGTIQIQLGSGSSKYFRAHFMFTV